MTGIDKIAPSKRDPASAAIIAAYKEKKKMLESGLRSKSPTKAKEKPISSVEWSNPERIA